MPTVADKLGHLVTRDLTQAFARQRRARRKAQQQQQRDPRSTPNGTEALIGADGGPASPTSSRGGQGPSLPPQWVDFSDKAHEDIREIRSQLVQLIKAQEKRFLQAKSGDGLDKEIQALSSSIATLIRCCEQSIHQVRTYGGTDTALMDDEFRQNVQRSLAAQLQQLSKQCREAQKDYLKRRQQGTDLENGAIDSRYDAGCGVAGGDVSGSVQTLEFNEMEEMAAMRSTEIAQIASSINELHQIFKDLAGLVIEQGTILDRIDYNTEKIYKKSDDAKGQMQKAVKRKKTGDSRVMKCFIFWVIADVLLFLMLLVKYQQKYGLRNVFWFLCFLGLLIGGCVVYAKRRSPQLLSSEHWIKACPDLDPKALWRRVRPGPVNTAKAAGAAARAGGLGAVRQAVSGPGL
uniref:t-SNARE coiled-coil homology domain-containing protein n=1 Tax=Pyrodinium bahamense TaxID=73915 RepID=A0A7R9ZWX9_9DINO